jgi:hypothetical protein
LHIETEEKIVKTGDSEVMLLQASECQAWLTASTEMQGGQEEFFPGLIAGNMSTPTLGFQTSSL